MIFSTNSTEAIKGPALFGNSSQEPGRAEKEKKRQREEQKKKRDEERKAKMARLECAFE